MLDRSQLFFALTLVGGAALAGMASDNFVGVGAAPTMQPQPKYLELDDGGVIADGHVFDSVQSYFQSDYFQNNNKRCATPEVTPDMMDNGDPSDCSLSLTDPDPMYDPSVQHYQIPVVFHILHRVNGVGNISDQQIFNQIDVLNEDFLALPGTNGAPGTDIQISFFLATEDPNGQPTTGITRSANDTWFNDQGGYYNSLAWDTNRYLNIYVNAAGGNLGYVPGLPQQGGLVGTNADRVVCYYRSVGKNTGFPPYHWGRTATHELGHYFGCYHTFQSGCASGNPPGCYSSGDRICDTNSESGPVFGCPGSRTTCNTPDPYHNYLDYSDDLCMNNWTPEQARRMRCTLENYRPNLAVSNETVRPDSFEVQFGRYLSGDATSLYNSDDDNVDIEQRAPVSPLLPNIRIEIDGDADSVIDPAILTYTFEASANALPANVPQRIELFNQDGGTWETIDERTATTSQSVIDIEITTNPGRFVSGSGGVLARANWFSPGDVLFANWGASIDQAIWTLEP